MPVMTDLFMTGGAFKVNTSKRKMLLIYNPRAGKGTVSTKIPALLDMYTKEEFVVTVYPIQPGESVRNLVSTYESDFNRVVCIGGDGTLNHVVNGMMMREDKTPIGYIPTGSTNDYAKSLGLPKSFMEAARISAGNRRFSSDIGKFADTYFVYVAAFGLFSAVSYMTNQEMKNILGHSAYVLEGMKSLSSIPKFHIKVESDQGNIEGDYILGMVSNSISVGGFKKLFGNDVSLDDGYYELTLARQPETAAEFQELLTCFLNNKLHKASVVDIMKVSDLKITSDTPIAWSLDGEFGGEYAEVEIKNCKQALEIIV